MQKFILYLTLVCFQFSFAGSRYATTIPASGIINPAPAGLSKKISSMEMRDLKKVLGRKATLKEKIAILYLKHKVKKAKAKDAAHSALTMGFIAIGLLVAGLFIPYVIIAAFIAGVLALVMGGMAKKPGEDNRKAKTAQLLGGITLAAIALILLAAVILVASIF